MAKTITSLKTLPMQMSKIKDVSDLESLLTSPVKRAAIDAVLGFNDLDEEDQMFKQIWDSFEGEEFLRNLLAHVQSYSGVEDLVVLIAIVLADMWD